MEQDFINEILQRLTRIETKIDQIDNVTKEVTDIEMKIVTLTEKDNEQQRQIDEMKDNNKWLKRAVIGAIITAAIGVLFTVLKNGIGM